MNRAFDIIALIQIPLGFLCGLVVLLVLEIFEAGFLVAAFAMVVVALLYFLWIYIEGKLSFFNPVDWIFFKKQERESMRRMDERDRKVGRLAFPLGLVLALGAAQIWSPLEISKALF